VLLGTTPVGALYELHPTIAERYGLSNRVAILELNLSTASATTPNPRRTEKPSLFPQVERDIAFLVDTHAAYEHLAATIKNVSSLITHASLLDHYQGEQLPSGTKSLTLRLTLGTSDRTLTTAEIDEALQAIIKQLTEGLSKMVKEVTVTVIYKAPKSKLAKPLEYSVTTYFVDYDKEVSFGMPGG
jgi:phenylalanyl-tRNA synthetase beta chain